MEHRWHQRFATDLAAELIAQDKRIPCRIGNFSAGGLFLKGALGLKTWQIVTVSIPQMAASKGVMIEPRPIRAMVVHLREDGAGLEAEFAIPPLPVIPGTPDI